MDIVTKADLVYLPSLLLDVSKSQWYLRISFIILSLAGYLMLIHSYIERF